MQRLITSVIVTIVLLITPGLLAGTPTTQEQKEAYDRALADILKRREQLAQPNSLKAPDFDLKIRPQPDAPGGKQPLGLLMSPKEIPQGEAQTWRSFEYN